MCFRNLLHVDHEHAWLHVDHVHAPCCTWTMSMHLAARLSAPEAWQLSTRHGRQHRSVAAQGCPYHLVSSNRHAPAGAQGALPAPKRLGLTGGGCLLTCSHLAEAPANLCTPQYLAQAAQTIAAAAAEVMTVEVLDVAACIARGMGCYLAVGAASAHAPHFIHLTYKPGALCPPTILPSLCCPGPSLDVNEGRGADESRGWGGGGGGGGGWRSQAMAQRLAGSNVHVSAALHAQMLRIHVTLWVGNRCTSCVRRLHQPSAGFCCKATLLLAAPLSDGTATERMER